MSSTVPVDLVGRRMPRFSWLETAGDLARGTPGRPEIAALGAKTRRPSGPLPRSDARCNQRYPPYEYNSPPDPASTSDIREADGDRQHLQLPFVWWLDPTNARVPVHVASLWRIPRPGEPREMVPSAGRRQCQRPAHGGSG
jgi:hypothetical protein